MKVFIALTIAVLLAGCSTSHTIDLTYQLPTETKEVDNHPTVSVGGVADSRGTASNWIGAIRGGYGNPLKKLYSLEPTANVIALAFEDALRYRNLLEAINKAPFRIDITIHKFDTSYYFNKEAHADLTVEVIVIATGTSVFKERYRTDNEKGGTGAGIFGNAEALGEFANLTLNQTIDKILDDPKFLAALTRTPIPSEGSGIADRLEELQSLRNRGLISKEEYDQQRAKILSEI